MGTGRIYQSFGDEVDPASNAPSAVSSSTLTSAGAAPTNGQQIRYRVRSFDPTTDQGTFFTFWLPSNYASGGTLNFQWATTATSGNVFWKTGYALGHPASEGAPTDLDALSIGTVTAASSAVPTTSAQFRQVATDLGVTGAHGGDLLVVYFGRDADNGGDNATAALLLEPWFLTFATV